jgi:hypothetical protein
MFLDIISFQAQLVNLLADFNMSRSRLSLIRNCLDLLKVQTLASSSASASSGSGAGDAGADADAAAQRAIAPAQTSAGAARPEADTWPVSSVVTDTVTPYKPTDEFWVKEWRRKCDDVQKWHATVAHLRVFVCTSRPTAQTMLAAAAVIVAFLLMMSLLQMSFSNGSSADIVQASVQAKIGDSVDLSGNPARGCTNRSTRPSAPLGEVHALAASLGEDSFISDSVVWLRHNTTRHDTTQLDTNVTSVNRKTLGGLDAAGRRQRRLRQGGWPWLGPQSQAGRPGIEPWEDGGPKRRTKSWVEFGGAEGPAAAGWGSVEPRAQPRAPGLSPWEGLGGVRWSRGPRHEEVSQACVLLVETSWREGSKTARNRYG